jgi:branched-chain amino acid transport system ATP-binding protein
VALLEVDGLTVRFGGLTALDGIGLSVAAGDFVSIIGPNGAGKTTLFNVIAGAQAPTRGEVRLDGRSMRGVGASRMSHLGVSRTFQVAKPFRSLSVRENVRLAAAGARTLTSVRAFGPRLRARGATRRVEELLALTDLEGVADRRAVALNIGELRRLELARALAAEPRLLLLDEPAAGIGADGMRPLAQLIRGAHERGLTVLLVEHHVGFALSLCDRAVVLDAGQVIASGTPEAVRSDPAVVNAYLGRSSSGSRSWTDRPSTAGGPGPTSSGPSVAAP